MSYIGNQPSQAAFVTDQFSGNPPTVAFTMSVAPANTASVLVAISGVVQDPSTYSVAGTTLTFSAAPPTGTGNISVRYLGIPASGVTTTAYRTVTEYTATAGQTTFTPPSYTVGYIDVYRNGVRLGSGDFTATDGVSVVLASAATLNDLITTESFYVSSVTNAIPATAGAVNSTYIANSAVTPAKLSQPLTLGTAVASTSGTSIDFTNIPSWVNRVTVIYQGVSLNNADEHQILLGTSSGFVTTGYSYTCNSTNFTTGFVISGSASGSGYQYAGTAVLTRVSGNLWVVTSQISPATTANATRSGNGWVNLGSALTQLRCTTNGTGIFDAGSINILYE